MLFYIKYYFLALVLSESFFMYLGAKKAGVPQNLAFGGIVRHILMYSPVVYALFAQ